MGHSLVSIAPTQSFETYQPWSSSGTAAANHTRLSRRAKQVPAAQGSELVGNRGVSAPKSTAGFLVVDCHLSLVSFNEEALQILSYPDPGGNSTDNKVVLEEKIRSSLISGASAGKASFVTELHSGRRRYVCRAFAMDSILKNPAQPMIAVLLERGLSGWATSSQIAKRFNLTQREREVLAYLLQGMSNKGIANRMNLSINTIKAFLRYIMVKTGASSRSAILAKAIMTSGETSRPSALE